MKLTLTGNDKPIVFSETENYVQKLGLKIIAKDETRPWGGFFVIDETQATHFGKLFFEKEEISTMHKNQKLSPKILLVQPLKRLSWQYHHRRAEIWKVIAGRVGVITSDSDTEGLLKELREGDMVRLARGQRHRLVGLDGWGVLAEIWQHTDPSHPSDEEDIVRVQDDFGR
ncbi:MAG: phosphoheptose isomerase [Cytophagales bacterium]|nr:phosphoheptose isomerase [Cytophagales bacterium]